MAKKFPKLPKHPERICWGCDKYCPVDSLSCGNGFDRTQHPIELLGDDWYEWGDWDIVPASEPANPAAKPKPAVTHIDEPNPAQFSPAAPPVPLSQLASG